MAVSKFACVFIVSVASLLGAESQGSNGMEASNIPTVPAYARDGPEVGQVSSVKHAEGGEIAEIRIRVSPLLGFGERTVAIPGDIVIVLEGAVVVELTADEVAGLPS